MKGGLFFYLVFLLSVNSGLGYWQLTFNEEFTQTKLNTSRWNPFYRHSPAVINEELQYYTADAFKFEGQTAKLVAEKRSKTVDGKTFSYTSGAITTSHRFSQTYGYFEIRAKVPTGLGFWPAFWLLPENENSAGTQEIDVFEMVMDQPKTVYTTFHCKYETGGASGKGTLIEDFDTSVFHRFGVQWIPGRLLWYVDGKSVYNLSSSCVPEKPLYMLANLAVGGGWPQPPTAATPFPRAFEIDYIKVYKYSATSGVSIGGPGQGLAYTGRWETAAKFRILNPSASPERAVAGQSVNVSVSIVTSSTAYTDAVVQFLFYSGSYSHIGTALIEKVSFAQYATKTVTASFKIPSNTPKGYISYAFGTWTKGYASQLFYESTVGVIGIDKTVGISETL